MAIAGLAGGTIAARLWRLLFCACAAGTTLLCFTQAASAAPYKYEAAASEGLSKSAPGEAFQEPWSPTFDAAGNLYLVDTRGDGGKAIIDKFNAADVFQAQLGAAALSNEYARSVAVNDATGHLYVGDSEFITEPLFSDIVALGGGGEKLSQWSGASTPAKSFGEGCCYVFAAVDNSPSVSKGDVYVATPHAGGEVDVLEPQSADKEEGKFVRQLEAPLGGFSFAGQGNIAINNANGEVYVVDAGNKVVDRYSPAGVLEAQIKGPTPSEAFEEPNAVAVDGATGAVFVSDNVAKVIDKLSPTGELLAQIKETGANEPLEHPVGLAVQQSGPQAGELYVADSGKKVIDVFAEEQPGAPSIESVGVQQLSEQSASFAASINPHGTPTEYRFEYGRCTGACATSPFESSAPSPDGSLAAEDFIAHAVAQVTVQGLTAATTYHFRLVAHNVHGEVGQERVFTTQGAGGTFALPDNRAWELVSPPDKHGAQISRLSELGVIQAAVDGSAISYLANGSTESQPQGAAAEVQVLSTRSASGWSSRDIATPHEAATGDSTGTAAEYRFFSEDLSTSIVQPFGLFNPALSLEASEQTPYVHALGGCSSSCFHPLVTGKAGFANVPAGTKFGEELLCEENNGINGVTLSVCGPRFQGATPDAKHVVLRATASLVAGVPGTELYEWAAGHLVLVSILPPAAPGAQELPAPSAPGLDEGPLLGTRFGPGLEGGSARRAISANGARVFFESGEKLYVRDTAIGESLQIDAPAPGCTPGCEGGHGRFQIASSADGSRVFFTDEHRLTSNSGAKLKEPDLYQCKITLDGEGRLRCELTDLTPAEGSQSANVLGDVLGASEDGSSIYFMADGTLAGAAAQRGTCISGKPSEQPAGSQCNLYLSREGSAPTLVASLSGGDGKVWGQIGEKRPARVSPDGKWVTFMSERPLTGYDNTDSVSGKPDAEVFLYGAAGAGHLSCASCDPSGARPLGVEYTKLESGASEALPVVGEEWVGSEWVAAILPRTSAFDLNEPSYQADYLSNTGRLYFNALDALVPQDTNGTGDVYQYEPPGIGTCATAGGCVGLISSGTSSEASAFLDASASGNDVFFLTASRLTSQDTDSRKDVYDAHVCSSAAPCFEAPASQPPPCSSESCKAPAGPEPSLFGAPASSTFSGPGNLAPPPPTPPQKPKKPTRAQLLAKAIATCHKRFPKSKQRRGSCERQARAKYGAKGKKASAKKRAKGTGR